MGVGLEVTQEDVRLRPEGSEVMRLLADHSELSALTGWALQHTLEDGLRRTAQSFTDPVNLARYRVGDSTI